jgi:hypothetical protein
MATSTLNIGTEPQKRGELVFTGANDIGPQLVITLPLVQFSPSAAHGFIGDAYGLLEMTGEVLADETGSFGTVLHPDDAATSPAVGNYYVGTGVVTWKPEATTTVPTPTARDVGNVNLFEFTQTITSLDHWSHRTGIRTMDFRPVVQQQATVRMQMDEFTAENLRLAMLAG